MSLALSKITSPGKVFHTNALVLDPSFKKKCKEIQKQTFRKETIEKVIIAAAILSFAIFPLAILLWMVYWHFSAKWEALLEKEIKKEYHAASGQIPKDLQRNHTYKIDGKTYKLVNKEDAERLSKEILSKVQTSDPVQYYNFLNYFHQGISSLPLLFVFNGLGEGFHAKGTAYTRNCEVIKKGNNLQLRSIDTISIYDGSKALKTFKTQTTLDLKTLNVTIVTQA